MRSHRRGAVFLSAVFLLAAGGRAPQTEEAGEGGGTVPDLKRLERSYWLHASLASRPYRGYWGPELPASETPSEESIRAAAALLSGEYAANRLYLIYNHEIPLEDARRVFDLWRESLPGEVDVVPSLVLRTYDPSGSRVFSASELAELAAHLRDRVGFRRAAVYDVHPNREYADDVELLAREYPEGLLRVGLQPGEAIGAPFAAAVEDDWSGLCHGKTNEDWRSPGFGAETLRGWIAERNRGTTPIAWDLVAVAWDYSVTERGEYPGYDDAARNMPLPAGRNLSAAETVLAEARPEVLAGFSSDLFIVHANSMNRAHDGPGGAFYETLKRGEFYRGYYGEPFEEIVAIYRRLREGRLRR